MSEFEETYCWSCASCYSMGASSSSMSDGVSCSTGSTTGSCVDQFGFCPHCICESYSISGDKARYWDDSGEGVA